MKNFIKGFRFTPSNYPAEVEEKINIFEGDAVEILPTLGNKYDVVFIDAAKGKYPFFLKEALRITGRNT